VVYSTEETAGYDIAEPRADCMIQSMRAFGYDLPTAIADLIDNSISAGAKNVWLDLHWNGEESCIALVDDGCGMTAETLVTAMRPGSRSPLEVRDSRDLGRFGLGLKTASFSQCRRVSVGSKANYADLAVRCWDLDYVTACGQWRLLRSGSKIFEHYLPLLFEKPSGTVVVWEVMDRITSGTVVNSAEHHSLFLARAAEVKEHVAMVFHRFLEKPAQLRIFVNGEAVMPWDPYLTKETATQLLAEEALTIFGERLHVRPYVLPHHSKISPETHRAAAGPRGWTAQQGFYVYRNHRLLAAGDWLGLGYHKEEHYKLARILLDIPNSMDAEWEIDVKKSRAVPPPAIRRDLRRLANITRKHASDIYRYRGARIHNGPVDITFLWQKRVRHGKVSYEVNREHPLVKDLMCCGAGAGRKVRALLSLIEETVPVPTITMDSAENPDKHEKPFENAPAAVLQSVLRETYRALRDSGLMRSQARLRIASLEPFHNYPELIASLDDEEGTD